MVMMFLVIEVDRSLLTRMISKKIQNSSHISVSLRKLRNRISRNLNPTFSPTILSVRSEIPTCRHQRPPPSASGPAASHHPHPRHLRDLIPPIPRHWSTATFPKPPFVARSVGGAKSDALRRSRGRQEGAERAVLLLRDLFGVKSPDGYLPVSVVPAATPNVDSSGLQTRDISELPFRRDAPEVHEDERQS